MQGAGSNDTNLTINGGAWGGHDSSFFVKKKLPFCLRFFSSFSVLGLARIKWPTSNFCPNGPLPMSPIAHGRIHAARLLESRANDADSGLFLGPLNMLCHVLEAPFFPMTSSLLACVFFWLFYILFFSMIFTLQQQSHIPVLHSVRMQHHQTPLPWLATAILAGHSVVHTHGPCIKYPLAG